MISRWHILISGFQQDLGRPTGIEQLWLSLRPLSSPETSIQMFPWDAEWADVASFIDRTSYPFPSIYVAAYSWGVGHGFLQLAAALDQRGRPVAHATLCDGVYKPALRLTSWLALTPWPKLKIPANVRSVSWFRQHVNTPAGHDLIAVDPQKTRIADPVVLSHRHDEMDEAAAFQLEARQVAGLA